MTRRRKSLACCLALMAGLLGVLPAVAAAESSAPHTGIVLVGGPYIQDFDTLANTGASGAAPDGWAFAEGGSGANATYTAGTGSSTTGDTYSFGASGSVERAFGGLRTGSLNTTVGAEFQNATGATIVNLAIRYVCEQWRVGVADRGAADRMDLQISTDATSLTTGAWVDVDSLDCLSTNTATTVGAKNGNDAAFRTVVMGAITGLAVENGATFWLRWTDFDIAGADDGLGIDDFSISPVSATAVILTEFSASQVLQAVRVTWRTLSEIDSSSFNLYSTGSASDPPGPDDLLATVPSQAPGSPQGASYEYWHNGVVVGQAYWYWLEAVNLSGAATLYGPVGVTVVDPTAVTLAELTAGAGGPAVPAWPAALAVLALGLAAGARRLRVGRRA